MTDKKHPTPQDQLLTKILDDCMEEQLSFVPPEREIARMHKFSPEFLERMAELLRTQGKAAGRKLEKREFIYGFNKIAACILAVLAVGGLSVAGISLFGPKGSSESADTAINTESAAWQDAKTEAAEMEESTAVTEESAAEEAEPEEPAKGEQRPIPKAEFLGRMLEPAAKQELPEEYGNVKTLVNSPMILRDAEEVLVTIGNMETYPIRYYQQMDLEVFIDGYWYLVPPIEEPSEEEMQKIVVLESEMAQDETILLGNYELDYDAEKYRIVTYIDGITLCSEFQFGDEELFGEEEPFKED